jgi:hypothetical protein
LHTDDVPKEHLELLSLFWECRLVQHIEARVLTFKVCAGSNTFHHLSIFGFGWKRVVPEFAGRFYACKTWRWRQVAAAQRLSTDSRIEESRFFKVFTKLRALEQIDFEKVLVMDIDLLVARPQKVI